MTKNSMKIHKSIKIEEVCSSDETRKVLHHPYLDVENKVLVATDGRCMAIVPVHPEEGEISGFVCRDALANGRKNAGRDGVFNCVMNGLLAIEGGGTFARPDLGTFPKWQQVVPKMDEWNAKPAVVDGRVDVALNLDLLVATCKAIGLEKGKAIHLRFQVEGGQVLGPILVTASQVTQPAHYNEHGSDPESRHPLGIVMPMRLS